VGFGLPSGREVPFERFARLVVTQFGSLQFDRRKGAVDVPQVHQHPGKVTRRSRNLGVWTIASARYLTQRSMAAASSSEPL
jgi:hypothetical protein